MISKLSILLLGLVGLVYGATVIQIEEGYFLSLFQRPLQEPLVLEKDRVPYLVFDWSSFETNRSVILETVIVPLESSDSAPTKDGSQTKIDEDDSTQVKAWMRSRQISSYLRMDPSMVFDWVLEPLSPDHQETRKRRLGFCDGKWSGWYCDGSSLKECSFGSKRAEVRCALGCHDSSFFGGEGRCVCGFGCQNGGTFDRFCSVCSCPSPWSGPYCSTCSISRSFCTNGGSLDFGRCECSCPLCRNGGRGDTRCGCTCPAPWRGDHCEVCGRDGSFCLNGGSFRPTTCDCDCSSAPSCVHGRRSSDGSCGCTCDAGWGGPRCDQCLRDDSFCLSGYTLDRDLCRCSCQEATCLHGGRVDPTNVDGQRCACTSCSNGWEGVRCELCGLSSASCQGFNGTDCSCPTSGALGQGPNFLLLVLLVGSAFLTLG